MSPADWLLTVLACYFHDIGMLVTRDEYDRRHSTGFPVFKTQHLLTPDTAGKDYAEKVARLGEQEAERFLYQEYVRKFHAQRVRVWIENPESKVLGAAQTVAREISSLLSPLGETFRSDLGLVCESHHLDDLDRVDVYKLDRPYGATPAEAANLQYSALLLRTVDLLHITRDRTPSVVFRVLNPSDPTSQLEWVRHMSVVVVRSQVGRNRDGVLDIEAPRDTVEVHARLSNQDGFFGLTAYLSYASRQMKQNFDWAADSCKQHASQYVFPWRSIDQTNIETKGFLAKQFEFTIDQYKILELLTGHTLYNDINVVLRELTQNAIDAVRLQHAGPRGEIRRPCPGAVQVEWDRETRTLTIKDNGTGMTQSIIEQNFLRVGASRYQDPKFQEAFPSFSPISRFGIGVLSAFMIADSVEVITCHPNEPEARHLSLRNVHGKYLIRLLNKETDELARSIGPHGTLVKLRVRASADIGNVGRVLDEWFVLPGCTLTVQVGGESERSVGFETLEEALLARISTLGITSRRFYEEDHEIRVKTFRQDGVTVAYAVIWSPYFKVWSFYQPADSSLDDAGGFGTCVEGVRVRKGTPGYSSFRILAIANAEGPGAPKTNVARSDLEETPEHQSMLSAIYSAYCEHIKEEIEDLRSSRGFSMSRAASEGGILADQILAESRGVENPLNRALLMEQARTLPLHLIEKSGDRHLYSMNDLAGEVAYCTMDNATVRSAERLLTELPGEASLSKILSLFPTTYAQQFEHPTLVASKSGEVSRDQLLDEWEVSAFFADRENRQLEVVWSKIADARRWQIPDIAVAAKSRGLGQLANVAEEFGRRSYPMRFRNRSFASVILPLQSVSENGLSGFEAVQFFDFTYLLADRDWQRIFPDYADFCRADPTIPLAAKMLMHVLLNSGDDRATHERTLGAVQEVLPSFKRGFIDLDYYSEMLKVHWTDKIYDVRRWERSVNIIW